MRIKIFAAFVVFGGSVAWGQSAGLPAREAGLWQSTTTVTDANGQPIPNASDVVTVSCVDPSTDLKFFVSGASQCGSLAISGAGGHYTINGSCTQRGKPVAINETLDYASPQQVTLTAKVDAPMGPVTVTSDMAWQSPCLAGMVPGDEGSIVGGQFSKADNIDDSDNQ